MIQRTLTALLSTLCLGACQHGLSPVPAVLEDGSDETLSALRSHLAEAMGVANVELGAGDPTLVSTISVLPPRLGEHETRSPATPTQFNLIMIGKTCYAEQEGSDTPVELTGIACRAL
jgi:hypothetical protein